MPQLDLFKQDGTKVGAVEANDAVFGIEPNQHVLFQAVTLQRASLRQGTHKTKGRSEVSGGGRKPWRQKGTGRARQGSIRSPQWRGGGRVWYWLSAASKKMAAKAEFFGQKCCF